MYLYGPKINNKGVKMSEILLTTLKNITKDSIKLEEMMNTSINTDEISKGDEVIKINKEIEKLMNKINDQFLQIKEELASWKAQKGSAEIEGLVNDITQKYTSLLKKVNERKEDIYIKSRIVLDIVGKLKTNKKVFKGYKTKVHRNPKLIQKDV